MPDFRLNLAASDDVLCSHNVSFLGVKQTTCTQVNIPRQSRGLYLRSRSKRLFGVANAAPVDVSRLKAATGVADAAPNYRSHLKVAYHFHRFSWSMCLSWAS